MMDAMLQPACGFACIYSLERNNSFKNGSEAATAPPGGQDGLKQHLYNGVSEDTGSETSAYSEGSTTTVL